MEIKVVGIVEVPLFEDTSDCIISILDDDCKRIDPKNSNHFITRFNDLDDPLILQAPTIAKIRRILMQLRYHPGVKDKVLVHCTAGISRSPALAIGMEIFFNNKKIDEAFNSVERQRPLMWPNNLVIFHLDNYLCLGGKLIEFNRKYKLANF